MGVLKRISSALAAYCSSTNIVQTNVFCCCLIVNNGVALHATCQAWDFLGVNFWSRDFLGVLLEALGIFLGLDFLFHSIIPVT